MLLEPVHEFPGLARCAELFALFRFIYVNLVLLSILVARRGRGRGLPLEYQTRTYSSTFDQNAPSH